jgi:pilus assembly protein CpaB
VRASTIVMIGFAVLFGLLAVVLAQSWLNSTAEARMKSLEASKKPMTTQTIVVAGKPLRYGNELAAQSLREITWSDAELPKGAFSTISDVLKDGKRIVLTAIEPNEPVLSVKITGAGQRATLSALVGPGMKAVTIRVNDVDGVGGFVQPGDRVDVALTRQVDKENASTQVVLQNIRVLAVDQVADERNANGGRKVGDLEVDTVGHRSSLAGSISTLSLLLRKAGERHPRSRARHAQGSLQRRGRGRRPRLVHHGHGETRRGKGRLQRSCRENQGRHRDDGPGNRCTKSKKISGTVQTGGEVAVNNENRRRAAAIGRRHWEMGQTGRGPAQAREQGAAPRQAGCWHAWRCWHRRPTVARATVLRDQWRQAHPHRRRDRRQTEDLRIEDAFPMSRSAIRRSRM